MGIPPEPRAAVGSGTPRVLARSSPSVPRLLRVAIVIVVLAALVLVETTSRSGVLWRLTTFTYQVNVLAAAYYLWTLPSPARVDARPGLRGAVVLYVVVAGLVWNLFLTGMSMGYTAANVLLHVVMPILAIADWSVVGRSQGSVRWWQPLVWLGYPVVYLVLALLVLNEAGRRAPYYFLDPGSVGAAAVAGNVALLALAFAAMGYLISGLGRVSVALRRDGSERPRPPSAQLAAGRAGVAVGHDLGGALDQAGRRCGPGACPELVDGTVAGRITGEAGRRQGGSR